MAEEAAITIVTRMRDEASPKLQKFGQNLEAQAFSAQQLQMSLVAAGSAMAAMGSLMSQLDSPAAKVAGTFLVTAGAIMSTTSAIMLAMPEIKKLIGTLRALAIVQTIVAALTGPVGWARIAIGLGVAAAGAAGIVAMTGGFSRGGGTTVNINTAAVMGNEQQARSLARQIQTKTREDARLGR